MGRPRLQPLGDFPFKLHHYLKDAARSVAMLNLLR